MIPVAAALVMEDGRILLSQREEGGHLPLYWELPGGKVEEDEDPSSTLQRELQEELGVAVDIIEPFLFAYHEYPECDDGILLLIYRCQLLQDPPRAIGCRAVGWFAPEELEHLKTPPADKAIFQKLCSSTRESTC